MAKSGDNTAVVSAIDAAAQKYGVDPTALLTIAYIETGGSYDPFSKNPSSSAKGLFQFVNKTGKQYGLSGKDAYDVDKAADAAARLMRDNQSYLARVLGRDPTLEELYLAHQQGAGGAAQILTSPAGAIAINTLGYDEVYKNVPRKPGESERAFVDRVSRMTMQEFGSIWTNKARTVSQTRLPPGYVPGVGSQLDTRDTGVYHGLIPGSPLSGFFGVDPRPVAANAQSLEYARMADAARRGGMLPVDNRDLSKSNLAIPVPRPTFVAQPYGTRSVAQSPTPQPLVQLADPTKLMQVVAPATRTPTGATISQQHMQAIQAVPQTGLKTRAVQSIPMRATDPLFDQRFLVTQDKAIDYMSLGAPGRAAAAAAKPLSAPGAGLTTAQKQAMREVGKPVNPIRQYEQPAVAGAPKDPIGPGATWGGVEAFRKSGTKTSEVPAGITRGVSTTGTRSDGTSYTPVTYTGSPTSRPTSANTFFSPALGTGSANANRQEQKEEQRTVMKPVTVTRTIMVPNPAYKTGQVNPAAVGKLQDIHDREESRIMAAQQSNIPKMIPKTITETVMKPVTTTVKVSAPTPVAKPASVQAQQNAVAALKAQGYSSNDAYAIANQQAAQKAASKAGTTTGKTTLTSSGNPGWWGE